MKKYFRLLVIFFVFSCLTQHIASAQVVSIPDANLEAALRELFEAYDVLEPDQPITRQHMAGIIVLDARKRHITDLTGLEHATQLKEVYFFDNQIRDVSPLAGLTQLEWLNLSANQIRDVSPLANLTQLRVLGLGRNQIRDVSPLANLTQLVLLDLTSNQIPDVSPLAGLTNLTDLYLEGNPIQDTSPLANLTKLRVVDVEITAPPTGPVSKVSIPDPNLAAAVRDALRLAPNAPITEQAMQRLTLLFKTDSQIRDLTGLEHATQLEELILIGNQIRDIRPLAGLTRLQALVLGRNQISDIRPLVGLTQLVILDLERNQIRDVSPLAGLTQLVLLDLKHNQIRDVSPLAGLTTNLTELYLAGNPITDTSPLASLTKLTDVDVKITAPPSQPQPIPEDPTQPSPEPAPQETAETPQDEGTQPTETPAPSTITEGQITFSELMFATSGGLFSQPQWIELFNNGPVGSEPVNLRGLRLVIEARDSETRHRYSTIVFEDLVIKPKWTVLLVTRGNSRNSGYLSEDRVYNLYDHNNVSSLGLRDNAVLPASGFSLKLFAADGTLIDSAGNLDGVKRSKDTPLWELPAGWTEDRMRTSLIRRYEDGTALPGTEAMSWLRAADVELSMELYYGHKTDIGTPGYRRGGVLPVALSQFGADRTDAGVSIEWTTESETDNAGFNILRGQTKEGSFVQVNPTLIPGAGTTAERQTYTWTDTTAKPNVAYYYRIEDVSLSGDRQRLATVRMRGHVSANGKFTTTWSELKVQD